jgi:hypothetical protein
MDLLTTGDATVVSEVCSTATATATAALDKNFAFSGLHILCKRASFVLVHAKLLLLPTFGAQQPVDVPTAASDFALISLVLGLCILHGQGWWIFVV